jgi:hypothetical protein
MMLESGPIRLVGALAVIITHKKWVPSKTSYSIELRDTFSAYDLKTGST